MHNVRGSSKHLEIAKRGVEMAIEKSEKDGESLIHLEIRELYDLAQF